MANGTDIGDVSAFIRQLFLPAQIDASFCDVIEKHLQSIRLTVGRRVFNSSDAFKSDSDRVAAFYAATKSDGPYIVFASGQGQPTAAIASQFQFNEKGLKSDSQACLIRGNKVYKPVGQNGSKALYFYGTDSGPCWGERAFYLDYNPWFSARYSGEATDPNYAEWQVESFTTNDRTWSVYQLIQYQAPRVEIAPTTWAPYKHAEKSRPLRLAAVGQPKAGKSTFLNFLAAVVEQSRTVIKRFDPAVALVGEGTQGQKTVTVGSASLLNGTVEIVDTVGYRKTAEQDYPGYLWSDELECVVLGKILPNEKYGPQHIPTIKKRPPRPDRMIDGIMLVVEAAALLSGNDKDRKELDRVLAVVQEVSKERFVDGAPLRIPVQVIITQVDKTPKGDSTDAVLPWLLEPGKTGSPLRHLVQLPEIARLGKPYWLGELHDVITISDKHDPRVVVAQKMFDVVMQTAVARRGMLDV